MSGIMRRLTAIGAFAFKEIREILRQPRLVVMLILGPFLILGLFGIGYRANPPPLETILVFPEGSELAARAEQFQESLEPAVEIVDITDDETDARRRLLAREVDVVVVAPENAVETVRGGESAEVMVLHDKMDPFDQAYISIFSRASVDELNRAVLEEITRSGQEQVEEYDDALPTARQHASELTAALERDDAVAARRAQLDMEESLARTEERVSTSSEFVEGLERGLGAGDAETSLDSISDARSDAETLDPDDPDALEQARALEEQLAELEQQLETFTSLTPSVLVRPFVAKTGAVVGADVPLTTFYTPGVVVVLLQHILVTFGAMSFVREDSLGITDLFRVSPLTPTDLLIGKYLGYAVLGTLVGAVLMAGVVFGFGAPHAGAAGWSVLVLALTMAASLGLGFLIATWAKSDSQAVQFAMLTLLFTIFFSGFVLSLSRIVEGIRFISYAVPATAGIGALQDVMFRGEEPRGSLVAVLAVYAVGGFAIARSTLGRRLR